MDELMHEHDDPSFTPSDEQPFATDDDLMESDIYVHEDNNWFDEHGDSDD